MATRERAACSFNVRKILDGVYTDRSVSRDVLPDTHSNVGLLNALLSPDTPAATAHKLLDICRGKAPDNRAVTAED